MSANLLGDETSPYLLQHADNPVHWRPWSAAALAEARVRDRPLLLSIGYAACHWCHVMAHESFEDEATAALMNRLFVNVKVDREERPDVDHIYMSALHAMGEQGGWPLTMFLSPDGTPFFGGTYWPTAPRWGRPSFPQVLQSIDAAWRERRPTLTKQGQAMREHLVELARPQSGGLPGPDDLSAVVGRFLRMVDPIHGGIGGAPKFPNAPIFRFLWSESFRREAPQARNAVFALLESLCAGGIYDHLGGGFARYSTDAEWHVPHFEKMLYDNAQILELLALAYASDPRPAFAARAHETFAWLMREMTVEGAFAAAQDADQAGEEGLFFVWTEAEINAALGTDAAGFNAVYDVRAEGNWEGRNVLRRMIPLGSPEVEASLKRSREKLFALREAKPKPARDDKVLTDWNGLMIAALARSAAVFDAPEHLAAAEAAFEAIERRLRTVDGRLAHSARAGKIGAIGMLDDYAAHARAAVALFEASGDLRRLDVAVATARSLRAIFGSQDGGLFLTAADAADVPMLRPRHAQDGPSPSGAGMAGEVFARLYHLTGDGEWRMALDELLRISVGADETRAQCPTLLAAADAVERGACVIIVGPFDDPAASALMHAALTAPDPAGVVLRTPPDVDWPTSSPAHGRTMREGRATAYVCRGGVCGLPIHEAASLRAVLQGE